MSTPELGKVSLAELIRRAVEARRPDLRELRFDEEDNEVVDSLPVISDVPCIFPGGAGFSLTWPVKKGDSCLLVFTDRSLDKWLEDGGEVDPIDMRRHHLSDAVAILGVRSKAGAIAGFDGSHITIGKDGEDSDFVALAAKVKANDDAINSVVTTLCTHQHEVASAVAKPLTLTPPSVSAVGSATVKIKG